MNYPAASGRGIKDPTALAKKTPQAAGNLTLKRIKKINFSRKDTNR
jgi:hypothetical protein